MKKLLLFLSFIFLLSCNSRPSGERTKRNGFSIIVIDGCEYIEVSSMLGTQQGYYSLTHKGNCKNH